MDIVQSVWTRIWSAKSLSMVIRRAVNASPLYQYVDRRTMQVMTCGWDPNLWSIWGVREVRAHSERANTRHLNKSNRSSENERSVLQSEWQGAVFAGITQNMLISLTD